MSERLSEEKSFALFKELLLRHSVQRPPHSLAIFDLEDVKAINSHVQDTFYRFYGMYLYSLTKDQLILLRTEAQSQLEEPSQAKLGDGKVIAPREVEGDLKQFLSEGELAQIEKENEYMLRGPGRIEKIMRTEMDKLFIPGEEIVYYKNINELKRLVKFYIKNPEKRRSII